METGADLLREENLSVAQGQTSPSSGEGIDVSIVVPVLNEAERIVRCLQPLQEFRHSGGVELIVVDGGSDDDSTMLAAPLCDQVIAAPRGRALQMNAGVRTSHGRLILFLHSDTQLPDDHKWLEPLKTVARSGGWGFFAVRLDGNEIWTKVISQFINWRSRSTGIATGDQCLFVERRTFDKAGGFPAIALMEDIALSKALKRCQQKPFNPQMTVITSSRRWRRHGVVKTVLLMWWLRFLYAVGVAPERLYDIYYKN